MFLSPITLALSCAALMAIWVGWQIFHALFQSPLRHIPGPLAAKITPAWLLFVDLAGNRTSTIHKLHRQYGPAVVIGPHEVSFSDLQSIKDLYGQQTTFIKAPIYESMTIRPLGIFSLLDRKEHSQRRRLLSHAFSKSNLYESEPLIEKYVNKLLKQVEGNVGKTLDMLVLFRMTAFDIVGELFLGQAFGGLDSDRKPQFLVDMDIYMLVSGLEWYTPWLSTFLASMPIYSLQEFFASRQRLVEYGRNAFNTYIAQYGRASGRRDLLTKILSVKAETGETQLTDRETYTEIGNLVFAGTDTTSTTLTYLFWELSRNKFWQVKLREELLMNVFVEKGTVPTYKDIQDLPILNAVIDEALRLHPAAPASLPRQTPAGGKVLKGYFIPEKTIVSMQCYTTQRDATYFPDPEAFKPERWMSPNVVSNEMKELFMPFSKGSRACLGQNLALIELKLITARLVASYMVALAPTTTEESMSLTDHFLMIPKGGKCELIFTKAS